jgi:hypothetical protein
MPMSSHRATDLGAGRTRIAGVRKALTASVVVTIVALAAASTAGGDRTAGRVSFPQRLSVNMPTGWHLLTPPRPARFFLSTGRGVRQTCDGPSGGFDFKQAGRIFQVEVYLGPRTRPALPARAASVLAGLHARQIG